MPLKQASREITIQTPLGDDALLLRAFRGQEQLSQLFELDLELASENPSISYESIIGQNVTVGVTLAGGSHRYWNGWISRFAQLQQDSVASAYRATMVPWLWFLGQTTDCRIFQNKTIPDLLKQIFQENGYSDFSFRLYGEFAPRDYCVQYRESDLNFVSRLMEEEGIFYFFEHQKGKHTLVLGNDPAALHTCALQPKARYQAAGGGWKDDDVILEWSQEREFRPGVYSATDYNFETPATSLLSSATGKTKWELYDFPGEFSKRADGSRLVRTRLQEHEMRHVVARGRSDCRAFSVGSKFSLTKHYRGDVNQDYVITAIRHIGQHDIGYTSGDDVLLTPVYENTFECVPASTPIRPPRITPVPVVQGCHTAVVVGPGGEEIFTDKYGRVKVQFHWDREGKKNENSSCWMRVSYPTAGKGWGAIQIPRIGQEVIVDFIEGDPDRPIITGRTYNAGQMPPWDLPGKGMVSGFKSNSTKGGGGYNELAFDDTKGNELIRIHGQHDMNTLIEHDMDTAIRHDERRHVTNDRTKTVDKNESNTIGVNRTEKVGSNEKITIGADREEKVGGKESIHVNLTRTRFVGVNEMVNIIGGQEITVGALQAITVIGGRVKTVGLAEKVTIKGLQNVHIGATQTLKVDATQTHTIGGDQKTTIGGGQTVKITSDLGEEIGGNHTESVTADRSATIKGNDSINVSKAFTLEATESITLKTGEASITMHKNGNIEINGKAITINASGDFSVEAKGNASMKGKKVLHNC